jgi:hypothetical protein
LVTEKTTQVGQCPVEPHKFRPPGATPGPATYGRVRKPWESDQVESLVILWVRFPPRLLHLIPWSNGDDTCLTCRERRFNSVRGHWCWSVSVPGARLLGREEDRVQFPDGPLDELNGLLVQREDACPASRRSGFDSPAVHWCEWGIRNGEWGITCATNSFLHIPHSQFDIPH